MQLFSLLFTRVWAFLTANRVANGQAYFRNAVTRLIFWPEHKATSMRFSFNSDMHGASYQIINSNGVMNGNYPPQF